VTGRGGIPDDIVAEVRSRTDLVGLIGRHVKLGRAGRLWTACCPFHGEKTASFTVYRDHAHCFGCGAHVDAIGFTRRYLGLSWPDAVRHLADELGIAMPAAVPDARARERAEAARKDRERAKAARARAEARERTLKTGWAKRRAGERRPAETGSTRAYLRIDRVIPHEADYPDAIGFHPGRNALMGVAIRRDTGEITGGQFVHLDADGHALTDAEAKRQGRKAAKETFGMITGSVLHLPARVEPWRHAGLPVLLICEGVVDAAGLWQVTGQETDATLGLGNLPGAFRPDRANVVCLDDDRRGGRPWQLAQKAIRKARAEGLVVLIASPWSIRRGDGSDFNDILRQSGPDGPDKIIERLRLVLDPGRAVARRVSLATAEKIAASVMETFTTEAFEWVTKDQDDETETPIPPTWGKKITTAGGKSTLARGAAAALVRLMRGAGIGRPVAIAVPRHDLAEQQAQKLRREAPDLTVRVWKGLDRPGMCGEPERPARARARLLDTQKYACRDCPLFDGCAYQEQRHHHADIWIVAHTMLGARPPRPLSKVAAVFIDETPISAMLVGAGGKSDDDGPALTVETLTRRDPIQSDPPAAERLAELRGLAHAALALMTEGPLTAPPFRRMGLTAAMADEAHKLEWMTKVEPERSDELAEADINLDLGARTRFWMALVALLSGDKDVRSGWARLVVEKTAEGVTSVVRLRGRRAIHAGWRVPTMLMDASLQPDLARYLWPRLRMVANIEIEARHQHITQVIDRAYGLSTLDADDPRIADPGDGAPVKLRNDRGRERRRRMRALRDVRARLHTEARLAAPRKLLAVAQLRVITQIERLGPLPANMVWMHHGAVTGLDRFALERDAPEDEKLGRIVVIGRASPAPAAVEALREALTGEAAETLPAGSWYQRVDATHEMADGRLVTAERDHHPDPIAELFRQRITVLELLQIIGRGRGIRRGADDPLPVLVLTDVPLGIPVHNLEIASAETPTFEERQIAEGGVSTNNATHAARLYPELWRNEAIARYAQREHGGGRPAGTVTWRYQIVGQGAKTWLVSARPEITAAAVQAFIESRFGRAVVFMLWEPEPRKGASKPPEEYTPTGISTDLSDDTVPIRPRPFGWSAYRATTGPPPDG
jgi:hypothetical protein